MLFGRKLKLLIQIDKDLKEYTDLRINFNVNKGKAKEEKANITIYGLNLIDIQKLCTNFDYKSGKSKPNKIILEAGYQNDFGKIFDGAIMECEPKLGGADYQVNIKAQAGFYNGSVRREPISIINAKLSDIARSIASQYNVALQFECTDKEVGDYSFNGSVKDQFAKFTKEYGVKAWVENGILTITDKDRPKNTQATLLRNDSGLIGDPIPTAKGVNLVTLLRASFSIGSKLKCEFTKFPSLNGDYQILTLTHKGSNYGNDFTTQVEASKL